MSSSISRIFDEKLSSLAINNRYLIEYLEKTIKVHSVSDLFFLYNPPFSSSSQSSSAFLSLKNSDKKMQTQYSAHLLVEKIMFHHNSISLRTLLYTITLLGWYYHREELYLEQAQIDILLLVLILKILTKQENFKKFDCKLLLTQLEMYYYPWTQTINSFSNESFSLTELLTLLPISSTNQSLDYLCDTFIPYLISDIHILFYHAAAYAHAKNIVEIFFSQVDIVPFNLKQFQNTFNGKILRGMDYKIHQGQRFFYIAFIGKPWTKIFQSLAESVDCKLCTTHYPHVYNFIYHAGWNARVSSVFESISTDFPSIQKEIIGPVRMHKVLYQLLHADIEESSDNLDSTRFLLSHHVEDFGGTSISPTSSLTLGSTEFDFILDSEKTFSTASTSENSQKTKSQPIPPGFSPPTVLDYSKPQVAIQAVTGEQTIKKSNLANSQHPIALYYQRFEYSVVGMQYSSKNPSPLMITYEKQLEIVQKAAENYKKASKNPLNTNKHSVDSSDSLNSEPCVTSPASSSTSSSLSSSISSSGSLSLQSSSSAKSKHKKHQNHPSFVLPLFNGNPLQHQQPNLFPFIQEKQRNRLLKTIPLFYSELTPIHRKNHIFTQKVLQCKLSTGSSSFPSPSCYIPCQIPKIEELNVLKSLVITLEQRIHQMQKTNVEHIVLAERLMSLVGFHGVGLNILIPQIHLISYTQEHDILVTLALTVDQYMKELFASVDRLEQLVRDYIIEALPSGSTYDTIKSFEIVPVGEQSRFQKLGKMVKQLFFNGHPSSSTSYRSSLEYCSKVKTRVEMIRQGAHVVALRCQPFLADILFD